MLSISASLHHLTGLYAKSIFGNWSYYSGVSGKSTKVKKPYLEQLVFRGVQHNLIPILRSVGVFPKLLTRADKIMPQLTKFCYYYLNKNSNTKKNIKKMAQWVGEELIKPPPTYDKNGHMKKARCQGNGGTSSALFYFKTI